MARNRPEQLRLADTLIKDLTRILQGTPVDQADLYRRLETYRQYRMDDPTSHLIGK